jgi:hypothetical protein
VGTEIVPLRHTGQQNKSQIILKNYKKVIVFVKQSLASLSKEGKQQQGHV